MGLTSALNTSSNGLRLNETSIDVLGNNIANAGTNGFKASKALFATQLARTLSAGSQPTDDNGGTNPRQIGLGAQVATIAKDFSQGSITNSTSPSDLAIQGEGFFVLQSSGGQAYTRDGGFILNSGNELVSAQGLRVQGYGVDESFNLQTTELTDITIPLGELNVAQQTQTVDFTGALLQTGQVATQGAQLLSETLTDSSTGTDATAGSLLVDLEDSGGSSLFAAGETLSFKARKGGRTMDPLTMDIDGTSTLGDLTNLMDWTIGIHSGGTIPDDPNAGPGQPGVDVVSGQIRITGNMGTANDIDVTIGDLTTDGTTVPISFTKPESADGESAVTDFVIFDSLGTAINAKLAMVLESQNSTSSTFRYFLESADDSDQDIVLGDGTVTFDGEGNITDGASDTFSVDRDDSSALSPMQVTADFSGISGISTPTAGSRLAMRTQDGSAPGTLTSFAIDESGRISGNFDNGISRTLGQIALARFANPQGLLEDGDNTYQRGPNSGNAFITTAGSFGVGTIRAGAVELSNTDIGRNLIDLIVSSTNYRANARVIGATQELFDELLILGR